MIQPIIQTSNLCKAYRNMRALEHCTMQVPAGSIYGLVGPNGAGKTTLFRLICGLQLPTSGTFSLYGAPADSSQISAARRRVGSIIESPDFAPGMTASENLELRMTLLGIPDRNSIPELLREVGLEGAGRKKARRFSLGMRQRLGIALALAGSPDLLILDEPANGLDPEGILQMRQLILKLNRERGLSFLISSHVLGELERLATHYGFMRDGRIIEETSAQNLHEKCSSCLILCVSDTELLPPVLDGLKVRYAIESKNAAAIFGNPEVGPLISAIEGAGVRVQRVENRDETLETYYMRLMGGGKENA